MCLVKKWDYLEDHFARLEEKIKEEEQKLKPLTDEEKERIQLELDIIKKTDTASIFLLWSTVFRLSWFEFYYRGIDNLSKGDIIN